MYRQREKEMLGAPSPYLYSKTWLVIMFGQPVCRICPCQSLPTAVPHWRQNGESVSLSQSREQGMFSAKKASANGKSKKGVSREARGGPAAGRRDKWWTGVKGGWGANFQNVSCIGQPTSAMAFRGHGSWVLVSELSVWDQGRLA